MVLPQPQQTTAGEGSTAATSVRHQAISLNLGCDTLAGGGIATATTVPRSLDAGGPVVIDSSHTKGKDMCSMCKHPSCGFDEAMELYRSLFGEFDIPADDPEVDG